MLVSGSGGEVAVIHINDCFPSKVEIFFFRTFARLSFVFRLSLTLVISKASEIEENDLKHTNIFHQLRDLEYYSKRT